MRAAGACVAVAHVNSPNTYLFPSPSPSPCLFSSRRVCLKSVHAVHPSHLPPSLSPRHTPGKHDRGLTPPASLAAQLETVFKRHGTVRQKRRASFLLARALEGFGPPPDGDAETARQEGAETETAPGDVVGAPGATAGIGDAIRGMVESSTTRGAHEWDAQQTPAVAAAVAFDGGGGQSTAGDALAPPSAEVSYQLLYQRMRDESLRGAASPGVRSVEQACAAAAAAGAGVESGRTAEGEGQRDLPTVASAPELGLDPAESHRISDILSHVAVLAEKGRAHAALAALQAVDGQKRGMRVAVPYKVYALLFRALSNGYSARGRQELKLAAAPTEALEWLLQGMARQGYSPKTTILNFGLESFAVAAQTRKVRKEGGIV